MPYLLKRRGLLSTHPFPCQFHPMGKFFYLNAALLAYVIVRVCMFLKDLSQ